MTVGPEAYHRSISDRWRFSKLRRACRSTAPGRVGDFTQQASRYRACGVLQAAPAPGCGVPAVLRPGGSAGPGGCPPGTAGPMLAYVLAPKSARLSQATGRLPTWREAARRAGRASSRPRSEPGQGAHHRYRDDVRTLRAPAAPALEPRSATPPSVRSSTRPPRHRGVPI